MLSRIVLTLIFLAGHPSITTAQDFDTQSFEDAVNEAISDMPGVSFTTKDKANSPRKNMYVGKVAEKNWAAHVAENAPEFGFVVYDVEGTPVDLLGEGAPFQIMNDKVKITGYDLPLGYTVSTVGAAGYVEAAAMIAQLVEAPSDDVENAVQTVKGASAYIVQELCDEIARPTEITLNLTAGFKLAFTVETGSKFHWDLEVVCLR
ncbi:MAG: hypothetical protein GQ539_08570 [Sulfitobacter sp.]|nr:hypothetical protein [Sulfitobacter sp.]